MWLYLALLLFKWIVEMFSLKDDQTDTRYPCYNTIFQHIFSMHVTAAKLIPCKTFYGAIAAVNRHASAATHVQMFDTSTGPSGTLSSWVNLNQLVLLCLNVSRNRIKCRRTANHKAAPVSRAKESYGPIKLHSETQLFDQLTEGNTAHEVYLNLCCIYST